MFAAPWPWEAVYVPLPIPFCQNKCLFLALFSRHCSSVIWYCVGWHLFQNPIYGSRGADTKQKTKFRSFLEKNIFYPNNEIIQITGEHFFYLIGCNFSICNIKKSFLFGANIGANGTLNFKTRIPDSYVDFRITASTSNSCLFVYCFYLYLKTRERRKIKTVCTFARVCFYLSFEGEKYPNKREKATLNRAINNNGAL